MLEESLLRQIVLAWNADESRRHPGEQPRRAAPSLDTVRTVVEAVFSASIRTEEGRPLRPSVSFLSRSDFGDREIVGNCLVMPLSSSIQLSVGALEKLSPAVDPRVAALAVEPVSPSSPDVVVWAILIFGDPLPAIYLPRIHNQFSLGRGDILTVRAEAPGSILIARGDARLGSLVGGTFVRATPTPFIERGLGRFVMTAVEGNEGNTGVGYWHTFRNSMMYLLEQLSARTHGASLILVPSSQVDAARRLFRSRYSLTRDLQAHAVLHESVVSRQDDPYLAQLFDVTYGMQLCERLDQIAQLAAVDGAVVASASLDVLGFGATLDAPSWTGTVITGPDGFGGGSEPFDVSRHGTRHNSAVAFVGACPGSIAFVVSQDGPIRAFVKHDETTVLCWPDCRTSVFV